MPYIKQERRRDLDLIEVYISSDKVQIESPGELNYMITQLIVEYMVAKKLSYQTINDIVGALEGAKMEFYRRVAVPYENAKISENGDVYD
jgi:hypothetical protein